MRQEVGALVGVKIHCRVLVTVKVGQFFFFFSKCVFAKKSCCFWLADTVEINPNL